MGDATFGGAPWLVQYFGVQLDGAPPDTGAAPPGFGGAPPLAPPRTLTGVGLWNITDVLEFPSTLMEQRTLDARGVRCWTLEYYRCT